METLVGGVTFTSFCYGQSDGQAHKDKQYAGFYTKLNVWGPWDSTLNMMGVPSLKMWGGSHFFFYIILEVSTSFRERIRTGLSRKTSSHFRISPNQLDRNFLSFFGLVFEMIRTYLTQNSR